MYGKIGVLNPFYGRKHTDATKKILSEKNKGKKISPEHKALLINYGNKYRIKTSVYEYWVKKYGVKIADEKMIELKKKQSKNSSGSNNPMYGKPSPTGSGNGWSGWYKNWYFRSLRELKCVLEFEKNNLTWVSAEIKKYKVEYIDYFGNNRTYIPDFLVGDTIYECKPERLWKTPLVSLKKEYAIKYFNDFNLKYELIDYGTLEFDILLDLYDKKIVTFTKRYEEKFKNFFKERGVI
jgi:hypothetical protein